LVIARLMRAGRGRGLLAIGVVTVTMVSLGTRAAPVSAQAVSTLWGIDTLDNIQVDNDLSETQSTLGALPQFAGQYLVWGGETPLTSADAQFISSSGAAILLIDSPNQDFGEQTQGDPNPIGPGPQGTADAQQAIARAQSLGVPAGTAIFRDVEAGSPITTDYIDYYYSAFQGSRYVPGFYENPNGGTDQPFNSQYCAAVQNNSVIGSVPLWSSSPEKQSYTPYAPQTPAWTGSGFPGTPSCDNNTVAWQYLERGINSGSWPGGAPNVDVDEFNAGYSSLLWDGPLSPGTYTPVGPGAYTALQPFRVCDTRSGNSTECSGSPLGQGQSMNVQVTGVTGPLGQSVPSTAQSVVLNVTAISGSAGTFLTVFPTGSSLPTASNLNVNAQTTQANLVVAALGTGGQVSIYDSLGSINVAVDVEGYFAAPAGSSSVPGLFHTIAPLRICDTRRGTGTLCSGSSADNLLGAGQWTRVVVSGCPTGNPSCTALVPTNGTAEAVALNLTAISGTSFTYMSVVPPNSEDQCPSGTPGFSNINLNAQTNLPNRVIVPLGPDQDVCVYNSLGSINFVLDVNGWFGDGSETSQGASFYAVPGLRICDTRSAATSGYTTECSGDTVGSGQVLPIQVAGMDGIPAAGGSSPPVAVIANVTAVNGTFFTYFTLYPADSPSTPNASDLNVDAQQNTPNLTIVQLAQTGAHVGAVNLYNSLGSINAIVDVAGWFQ
jgi:hypothetical protein